MNESSKVSLFHMVADFLQVSAAEICRQAVRHECDYNISQRGMESFAAYNSQCTRSLTSASRT